MDYIADNVIVSSGARICSARSSSINSSAHIARAVIAAVRAAQMMHMIAYYFDMRSIIKNSYFSIA